jgi:hypothetical protein
LDVVLERDSLTNRVLLIVGEVFFKVIDSSHPHELCHAFSLHLLKLRNVFDIAALSDGIGKLKTTFFLVDLELCLLLFLFLF